MSIEYNIAENFIRAVGDFKDRTAIESRFGGRIDEVSYGQLGEDVKNLAYFISRSGIKASDRVAVILDNGPKWAQVFFALAYIGAIAVPLDPRMSEKDIKNILSDSGAKLVLISKEKPDIIGFLRGNIELINVEEIKESLPPQGFERAYVGQDDLMVLLYTSGTTDLPKGVMLTHKNLSSNYHSLKKMKIFSTKDRILSVLPLYHSYALMTTLIAPLFSGSKVIYVEPDWPEKLADYIRESKTTMFIGVPQIYHMMHSRMMKKLNEIKGFKGFYIRSSIALGLTRLMVPAIKNAFGKGLRWFISGGAKLDAGVAKDFFRLGLRISEGYGLTETSPVASLNPFNGPKIGSIGKPIPDVELKVVNQDVNGVGEIAIKGPNVMKGYYKNKEKTEEVLKDDWFLSGDLGYSDKDGYFYITGRSKEVIVLSSGKNIYPEEVEKHYSNTPYIKEMCVLGVLKERGGVKLEYLHAVVVPDFEFFKERGEMNVRKVLGNTFDNLSRDLPPYRHITGFTVTQEPLPRTVLGKLKRYEIQKKFLPLILEEGRKKEEITPEDETLLRSEVAQRLIKCLKDSLGIEGSISPGDSIELDLGVDSLGRVELVLAIEKAFNIEIPDQMVASGIFTVRDMIFKVEEVLKKGPAVSTKRPLKKEEKAVSWPEVLKQSMPQDFQEKIELEADWVDYVLTFLIKGFISIFFRIFYNLKSEGADGLPKQGPYVLCVNHTSFLDGFVVAAGVKFRTELELFFIAFRRYFVVPIVRNMVKRARIIPIDATQIIEAMQGSAFILKHGKALCIFPEGERSIDGEVKEFRKGIGIISEELDIPLVPVYIKGAFEAWPRTERFPKLRPIKVRFGKSISSGELIRRGMQLGAQDEYEAICLAIRNEVIKLK